jgi:hypothetical protein
LDPARAGCASCAVGSREGSSASREVVGGLVVRRWR